MIYSFEPIYDDKSRVLVLGSMASVESLRQGFYYMHPRNRFWPTIARLTGQPTPPTKEGKTQCLLAHGIAVMDILYSCNRSGSLDSAITDAVPNDIERVLRASRIEKIYCNGRKSYAVASKTYPHLEFCYLPSTSPANAGAWDIAPWLEIGRYLIRS